jgi:hypothetical protein
MSPFKKNQNKKVFGQEDQRAKKKKKRKENERPKFFGCLGTKHLEGK